MNPFAKSMHKCIHFGLRYVRKDFLEEKKRERRNVSPTHRSQGKCKKIIGLCLPGGRQPNMFK
jgi:hypothetical protein